MHLINSWKKHMQKYTWVHDVLIFISNIKEDLRGNIWVTDINSVLFLHCCSNKIKHLNIFIL